MGKSIVALSCFKMEHETDDITKPTRTFILGILMELHVE